MPLAFHRNHGLPFIAHLLQGDDRHRPLTFRPAGGRIQEWMKRSQVLTRDHRVHAWQSFSLLGIDGDQTCRAQGEYHMVPSRVLGGQGRCSVSMTCPVMLGPASRCGVCTAFVPAVVIICLVATIVAQDASGRRDPRVQHW